MGAASRSTQRHEPCNSSGPMADDPARGGRRALALLFALALVWGLLMRQFGGTDVYAVMGPFALVVTVAVRLVRGRAFREWFRPSLRAVAVGLGLGALMTALTYPLFRLAVHLQPAFLPQVEGLYAGASTRSLATAACWVAILVLAEELLWRGALLEALERRTSRGAAVAASVTTYALAQLGTGSWIVFALALVCGSVWTLERLLTRSLLSSTLSHLIWTETVILLYPVA
jgi:membrane protease YdiL (CAAX protease family)